LKSLRPKIRAQRAGFSLEVVDAFFVSHGGQLESARYLLAQGADLNWVGYNQLTPLDAAVCKGHEEVMAWLHAEGAVSHKENWSVTYLKARSVY
jgi:hypothetical protein